VDPKSLPGVVVDDEAATKTGEWTTSGAAKSFVGDGYAHDQNGGKGEKSITFSAKLPKSGKYEVRLAYVPNSNRCAAVPVRISHKGGEATQAVNQQLSPPISDRSISLGSFEFGETGAVTLSNTGTTGYVVADAVQWIPAE
jgi:hypothetical protein